MNANTPLNTQFNSYTELFFEVTMSIFFNSDDWVDVAFWINSQFNQEKPTNDIKIKMENNLKLYEQLKEVFGHIDHNYIQEILILFFKENLAHIKKKLKLSRNTKHNNEDSNKLEQFINFHIKDNIDQDEAVLNCYLNFIKLKKMILFLLKQLQTLPKYNKVSIRRLRRGYINRSGVFMDFFSLLDEDNIEELLYSVKFTANDQKLALALIDKEYYELNDEEDYELYDEED